MGYFAANSTAADYKRRFEVYYREYGRKHWLIAYRLCGYDPHLASDLFMEAIYAAYRDLPSLHGIELRQLHRYIVTGMRRAFFHSLRQKSRTQLFPDIWADDAGRYPALVDNPLLMSEPLALDFAQLPMSVRSALGALEPADRTAIVLDVCNYERASIAKFAGCTEGEYGALLEAAYTKLRTKVWAYKPPLQAAASDPLVAIEDYARERGLPRSWFSSRTGAKKYVTLRTVDSSGRVMLPRSILDALTQAGLERDNLPPKGERFSRPDLARLVGKPIKWTTRALVTVDAKPEPRRAERGRSAIPTYSQEDLTRLVRLRDEDASYPLAQGWYSCIGLARYVGRSQTWVSNRLAIYQEQGEKRRNDEGPVGVHYPPDVAVALKMESDRLRNARRHWDSLE